MSKKIKKKKLNKKRTIIFILVLYIFCYALYFFIKQPIRHIEIKGNKYISDSEILRITNLKDYPSILKYPSWTIKNKIKKLDLIKNVKVKKSIDLKVKIEIEENKLLFYYMDTDKIALSNGNIINNDLNNVLGIPILKSELKSDLLNDLITSFSVLNENIIYEINYIEYYPQVDLSNNIINNNRFKLLMNDGNTIIFNTKTIHVLNKYNDIFASLNGKYGIINLDSNKISNLVFLPYEE